MKTRRTPTGRHNRTNKKALDSNTTETIVQQARQLQTERAQGYREQSLTMHPWVCARCGRVFTRENLKELTVHHKDHNHDNNPPDGSNWENLCIYCHDNEHARYTDHWIADSGGIKADPEEEDGAIATHNPFADLQALLDHGKGTA